VQQETGQMAQHVRFVLLSWTMVRQTERQTKSEIGKQLQVSGNEVTGKTITKWKWKEDTSDTSC